jgi:hypothetical protein
VRVESQAGVTAGAKLKDVSMGVAAGVDHEGAYMVDCSLSPSPYSRLMRLISSSITRQQQHEGSTSARPGVAHRYCS